MPKIKTKWIKIPDENLRHFWKCPECEAKETVSPDWYSDNGTPMCGECDCDMHYSHSEVKQ